MTMSVVFIDVRVADYQDLLINLPPDAELVLLDPDADGVLQMAEWLSGKSDYDAIHVLSHGSVGRLDLGDTSLSYSNLDSYADALATIGSALTTDGDLLFYGCNVAEGDTGQAFIQQLAAATGADVAASTDPTGATALGGDWVLEAGTGSIETAAISARNYDSVLAANTAPSFMIGDGKLTTDFGATEFGLSVALQPDGKILVAGYSGNDFALARYQADGTLDTSFSGDGLLTTDFGSYDYGRSVTVQADGKILIAGDSNSNFALVRYNADGTLDTSFSSDGQLITDFGSGENGNSVTLQADGKILVAGVSGLEFALARYNTDGSLDTSFSDDGLLTTYVGDNDGLNSITVQADGKILVAGYTWNGSNNDFALARYHADGSLDTGFSDDGLVTTNFGYPDVANSITVQPDGKILVAGSSDNDFALVRYNADGTLDTSFSSDGKLTTGFGSITSNDTGRSVIVQPDGKILVAGSAHNGINYDFALARYNADGSLDASFSDDGKLTTDFGFQDNGYSVTLQPDGRILVAGTSNGNFALARYNADGTLDTSFDAISTLDGTASFTEDGAAAILDVDVQVFDAELSASGSYDGATLTLVRHGGAHGGDRFSGVNIVAGEANGDVIVSATTIGSYAWTDGELLITFNGNATQALVDQAMQGIAYSYAYDNPLASVQIDWSFIDGNTGAQGTGGALAATGSTTVDITPVNDAPAIGTNTGLTLDEGATATLTDAQLEEADPDDSNEGMIYTITSAPTEGVLWLDANDNGQRDDSLHETLGTNSSFTQADIYAGRLKYTHDGGESRSDSFDFSLADGGEDGSTPAAGSFAITLTGVNDAPTFAVGDGVVTTHFNSSSDDVAYSLTVQPDGKILVAGSADNGGNKDFALARYHADGTLDTGFSGDGKLTTDFSFQDVGQSVTVQPDGKILVAGFSTNDMDGDSYFALARYNADGSLDTGFGSDGKLIHEFAALGGPDAAYSIALQADGKILAAGYASVGGDSDFALARYNADGTSDASFGSGGLIVTDFGSDDRGSSVTVQPDGKIVVAGDSGGNFALARYNANGTLDTSFSGDGKLATDFGGGDHGYSVALQPDGKIVVAGDSDGNFALARYNADGTLDASFSGDGLLTTMLIGADAGNSVVLQPDGKIVVAGYAAAASFPGVNFSFALARYNADGTLDTSFSDDGKLITDLGLTEMGYSVTLQPDGKILVGGVADNGSNDDFALLRYNTDGTLDTSFDPTNTLDGTPALIEGGAAVVLDPDVQIFDAELSAADDFSGATLTLARNGGANSDDRFSGANIVAGAASGDVVVSATTIGSYAWVSGELAITFNGNATQALLNQAMQSIAYANASAIPPASVQIDWSFSDGNSGTQGSGGALVATGSTTVTNYAGDNVIHGTSLADSLQGGAGNDSIYGYGGPDVLDGGTGADDLRGGLGNDTYVVDDAGDVVTELLKAGYDTVQSSVTHALTANVEKLVLTGTAAINGTGNGMNNVLVGNNTANLLAGLAGADVLNGNGGNDTLRGGDGNDTLNGGAGADILAGGAGIDAMEGSLGNDTYVVDNTGDLVNELVSQGIDLVQSSVSYTLTPNVEKLTLTGASSVSGTGNIANNTIRGNSADNLLAGLGGKDTLIGGAGNDTLNGGVGDDSLDGGDGADSASYAGAASAVTVYLSKVGGQTTVGAGFDTLVDIENLIGSAYGDDLFGNAGDNELSGGGGDDGLLGYLGDDTLEGGAGSDTLFGGGGADRLDGGTGADSMSGGDGDDVYIVDNTADVIGGESTGNVGGIDRAWSDVSYTLAAGAAIEILALTGSADLDATGNELHNEIRGNSGNNELNGAEGNDTLDGGTGADTMTGLTGNDTYVVDSLDDVIIEFETMGVDTVMAGVDYVLDDPLENLTLTGTTELWGSGNYKNNIITGNSAANSLFGLGGADVLNGGLGNDHLEGGSGKDTLNGSAGNDWLLGGGGADLMKGGKGNDTYAIDNAGDTVTELVAEGIDLVRSSVTYALGANVEDLTLTSTLAINGTGNGLNNTLQGSVGANRLAGMAGSDTLIGGGGNDTLLGGAGNDALAGGLGNDFFVFNTALDPATNIDTLRDYNPADDTIRLENAIFSSLTTTGGLSADSFVVGTTAADGNDFILYDASSGALFYDADADGSGAALQFASVYSSGTTPAVLSASEFVIF